MFYNSHTHKETFELNTFTLYNMIIGNDYSPRDYYSAGIHPWFIDEKKLNQQLISLRKKAINSKCLAIGECGLDRLKGPNQNLQMQVFQKQIQLADELNIPLIIHNVKCLDEIVNCLNKQFFNGKIIFHGFNTKLSTSDALIMIKTNTIYFSFGSALLKEKSNAVKLIKQLPLNRFLLETDDTDISIKDIYIAASQLLNIELKELMITMEQNFKFVFNYGID